MDSINAIPKITKSIPVPEYQESPFADSDVFQDQLSDKEKKKKEETSKEHQMGNDPHLGKIIDIDG